MHWTRAAVLLLVLIEAGWMAFDGSRALLVGDFITPKSGASAGQLGPWRHLVVWVGLNPRGTPMNNLFLTMLDKANVPHVESLGDSTGRLDLPSV